MKKGFSLVEIIISVSLLSVVFVFSLVAIKNAKPTYADPYEDIRLIITDATNIFLNSNRGIDYKEGLYQNGEVIINTNKLISEGLIEESYFVKNTNEEKELKNIDVVVSIDDEGVINYSINML